MKLPNASMTKLRWCSRQLNASAALLAAFGSTPPGVLVFFVWGMELNSNDVFHCFWTFFKDDKQKKEKNIKKHRRTCNATGCSLVALNMMIEIGCQRCPAGSIELLHGGMSDTRSEVGRDSFGGGVECH